MSGRERPIQSPEDRIDIAKGMTVGLLERMGIRAEVEACVRDGDIHLEIREDKEGILIGKEGRTLDSLQLLINRMVNRGTTNPAKVILDVDQYRSKREEFLSRMAVRLGNQVNESGKPVTVGPYNAHDRRIIHISLHREPSLKTESLGEGDMKKIRIVPVEKKTAK